MKTKIERTIELSALIFIVALPATAAYLYDSDYVRELVKTSLAADLFLRATFACVLIALGLIGEVWFPDRSSRRVRHP